MHIDTSVEFELDIDDQVREIAEEVMETNYCEYMTQEGVEMLINDMDQLMTWDEYHAGWHDALNEYVEAMELVTADQVTDVTAFENRVRTLEFNHDRWANENHELREAKKIADAQIMGMQAEIDFLHEKYMDLLDRTLSQRVSRVIEWFGRLTRKVHWHMPRR